MPARLCLIASKRTDVVIHGFLPAADRLGLDVLLLTDQPATYSSSAGGGVRVAGCDVWDFRALIRHIAAGPVPDAVFSNSDHLQAQTALAASYFGLPGKDWRAGLRAKDKPLMRRRLAERGVEQVAAIEIAAGALTDLPDMPYPAVVKPAEGVASEDVVLVNGKEELARRCAEISARRGRGARLIVEEYLPGTLRTLETLGDGQRTWVLGGFRTQLSPPPYFVEERLSWDPLPPGKDLAHVQRALAELGVSFGACHTEFVCGGPCGTRLIEVNDRLIGDHDEFLLNDLLEEDLFELVLRVSLGERLPASTPPLAPLHAVASYIRAESSGVLVAAPAPGPMADAEPGVQLSYWPCLEPGSQVAVTNSNRDYLGVLTALGPSADAVERSLTVARERGGWEISS